MTRVNPDYIKAQRLLNWPDIHPEDYCHRCGVAFDSWYTDRETWLKGTEAWAKETGREGICCVTCFTEMHGGKVQWKLVAEEV